MKLLQIFLCLQIYSALGNAAEKVSEPEPAAINLIVTENLNAEYLTQIEEPSFQATVPYKNKGRWLRFLIGNEEADELLGRAGTEMASSNDGVLQINRSWPRFAQAAMYELCKRYDVTLVISRYAHRGLASETGSPAGILSDSGEAWLHIKSGDKRVKLSTFLRSVMRYRVATGWFLMDQATAAAKAANWYTRDWGSRELIPRRCEDELK